jgi:Tol biopolymer transport system component
MMTAGISNPAAKSITQEEYHLWPRLSPSGQRLASVIRRPDPGEHLYLTDLSDPRAKKRRLSDGAARHPCGLDDDTVAYLESTLSGETEVLLANINNPMPLPMTRFKGDANWLAVHDGGKRVAVVSKPQDGTASIVLRDVERREDRVIAEGGEYQYLRWSPDGTALAWSGSRSADQSSSGIWVGQPGSAPIRLVNYGFAPVWDADGKTLYFCRTGVNDGLWRVSVAGAGRPIRVRSWRHVPFYDLAGTRMVFTQEAGESHVYSMSFDTGLPRP